MSRATINTMLQSPSLSVKMLAQLGKTLLDRKDYTVICSVCHQTEGVYEPAFLATTLPGLIADDEDPDYEVVVYHVMALCKRHALYNIEDINQKQK